MSTSRKLLAVFFMGLVAVAGFAAQSNMSGPLVVESTITSAGWTSTSGLTASGAAINLNVSSNFAVNAVTGTSTGTFTVGGTAGNTIAVGNDDTVADDIDIGSAKDDVLISGEDITFDTADDMNALVADDFTVTIESASGLFTVAGTAGSVITIGTDDTTADDIDFGSAKDDVDIEGEDITLDTSDDMDFKVADDLTITVESAGGIIAFAGTAGSVFNLGTDDTTADTINIGSAKDALVIDSVAFHVSANDVTLDTDTTGGNALAKNEFIGLPRIINYGIGTMVNGTTNTRITDIGDSQTPATDWTAVDASTTMTNDSSFYREGTASLKMAILGTATENDGCINTLASGDVDLTDDEGFGFWLYSDALMASGILQVVLSDSVAADVKFDVPAYDAIGVWQWMEVDITTANANKDVVEDISITLTSTGETQAGSAAWNVYLDFICIWDVADEDTLGNAIPYDGAMSLTMIDATSAGATSANLTLYTDYFVHYQTGNDAVVMITDQSGADKVGLVLLAN